VAEEGKRLFMKSKESRQASDLNIKSSHARSTGQNSEKTFLLTKINNKNMRNTTLYCGQ
jgi:hypothetical protein